MDQLQAEVLTLSKKLDALYRIIEDLDRRMSQTLSECCISTVAEVGDQVKIHQNIAKNHLNRQTSFDAGLEHKDVLADGIYSDSNMQGNGKISLDIQVQRLTAQLTAAYNRIAALEEQLLQKRIKS